MGIADKIKEIEEEYARTQKNKATEYHTGLLRAKLSKLKSELEAQQNKVVGGKGEGFDVLKHGSARIAMIGFPSVGKSSLLNRLTDQESEAAAYEFTTLTCIPGQLFIHGAELQLLDLPGIIEGAADGKGRGRQVIAVGKSSDLVLMILDAAKSEEQKAKLTREMENTGIRLNKTKPNITIKPQKIGGVVFSSNVPLTKIDARIIKGVMHEYKIHNAFIKFGGDYDVGDLIDTIEGNRKYVKCIYVYNKIDTISIEEVEEMMLSPLNCAISIHMDLGIDIMLQKIWAQLGLVRIYTKRRGEEPDFSDPIFMTQGRQGLTVRAAIMQIHRDLLLEFGHALVWGRSCKFSPQKCGLNQVMCDEDVIQIYKKVSKKSTSHLKQPIDPNAPPKKPSKCN